MPEPIVSVIIPSYNRETLIVKALNSIFNQTFQDFEVLVIDDASTDNTEQVIKSLDKSNIRYYKLEKNGGQCIARNFGSVKAKGKYIAFLDSDDEWLPDKLKLQLSCFEKGPERLGCVYGYAYQKDMIKNKTILKNDQFFRGDIYDKFLAGFCPPTPSLFMVRKDALLSVSGFDEKLITFVDIDLWLRLSQNFDFDYVEEPLIIKYEQIGDQYVNNFEKRYKGYFLFMKKWKKKIIEKSGKKGFQIFNHKLVHSLVVPFLEHPPADMRRNILKLVGLLISNRCTQWKYYIKSLFILAFGPNAIYFIRKKISKDRLN